MAAMVKALRYLLREPSGSGLIASFVSSPLTQLSRIAGIHPSCRLPLMSTNSMQVILPPVTSSLSAWMICGYEPVRMV